MRDTTRFSRWAAAFAVVATAAAMGAGAAHAYTIITRDGHRIEAQSPPEVRGLHAYMRLAPRGQLAIIQEERIDWARTEAANGRPRRIAVPADAQRAEGSPDTPAATGPIEKKIVGKSPAAADPNAAPAVAGSPAPGAIAPGSELAQEAIAKLRTEHAHLTSLRNKAVEERKLYAAELAALQSRDAGYAGADTTPERRVQELKDRIAESDAEIAKLESRMATISADVVQLGGSLP